jgi:hypothetical protein
LIGFVNKIDNFLAALLYRSRASVSPYQRDTAAVVALGNPLAGDMMDEFNDALKSPTKPSKPLPSLVLGKSLSTLLVIITALG